MRVHVSSSTADEDMVVCSFWRFVLLLASVLCRCVRLVLMDFRSVSSLCCDAVRWDSVGCACCAACCCCGGGRGGVVEVVSSCSSCSSASLSVSSWVCLLNAADGCGGGEEGRR